MPRKSVLLILSLIPVRFTVSFSTLSILTSLGNLDDFGFLYARHPWT
jgi:hypothetical protein